MNLTSTGTPLPRGLSGAKVVQYMDTFLLVGGRYHSGEITDDERKKKDMLWRYSDQVILYDPDKKTHVQYEPKNTEWKIVGIKYFHDGKVIEGKSRKMKVPRGENPKAMIVSQEIFPRCPPPEKKD